MLVQTLIAFAAVALLGLILRVFFGRGRDTAAIAWPSPDSDDFGLLAPAAVVDSREEANALRALLADAGIKATTTTTPTGRHQVLVFPNDLPKARRLTSP
jgi:hypothetical protein